VNIHSQSREDWDDFIILFTLLFGNFENKYQVLNYFNDEIEYLERYIQDPSSSFIEEFAIWEREIGGVHVTIAVARYRGRTEEHMASIFMSSDMDLCQLSSYPFAVQLPLVS